MSSKEQANSRKSQVTTAGDAIKEFLNAYNIREKFDSASVIAGWAKLMGTPIANRTSRIFIKDRKMFVELTSAPLKHELTLSKSKILDLFAQEFRKDIIEDIVFL